MRWSLVVNLFKTGRVASIEKGGNPIVPAPEEDIAQESKSPTIRAHYSIRPMGMQINLPSKKWVYCGGMRMAAPRVAWVAALRL